MRSLTLPNQYLRVLRLNTEQPVDPKAGYSRTELLHVDTICTLVDTALGEYEARIAKLLDTASADARLARIRGDKPDEVQMHVQQIQEICNQGVEAVDAELGMQLAEVLIEDNQFQWWHKNWQARDSFNGHVSARRAVFAIDKAFENAVVLQAQTADGERKLVAVDSAKPKLNRVK